jgi:hypothetical protein
MQVTWWEYRQWRFLADMNADGMVTASDLPLWAKWAYFVPGDAFIAQFGTTRIGQFLELTPASLGSPISAALSAVLWLLALLVVFYVPRLFIDIVDPTSRQQRRERRQAQRARKRQARLTRRAQRRVLQRDGARLQERREPTFHESGTAEPDVTTPGDRQVAESNRSSGAWSVTDDPHSTPDALPHSMRIGGARRSA